MATLLDLKQRIRSVENIGKITRAMQLVAAAKLTRAQSRAHGVRPYTDELDRVLTAWQVEAALESLPDASRELIILRKYEELTFPEIARRLGKSEDACRMAFSRAMAALTIAMGGTR